MTTNRENPLITARRERTRWFLSDRFGMFIHWGLYAIPARGEWIKSIEQINDEDYRAYFDEFNPTNFQPKVWAKMAKDAGMKYARPQAFLTFFIRCLADFVGDSIAAYPLPFVLFDMLDDQ